jgi:hypothetical protein
LGKWDKFGWWMGWRLEAYKKEEQKLRRSEGERGRGLGAKGIAYRAKSIGKLRAQSSKVAEWIEQRAEGKGQRA